MGREINSADFTRGDYRRFCRKLHRNLQALQTVLNRPDFGHCADTLGAELELYVIDDEGRPVTCNRQLQQSVADPRLTLELNRYNIEYNFEPLRLANGCFSQLENRIDQLLTDLNGAARQYRARILPVGILPTLKDSDLGLSMMTDELRYRVLTSSLQNMRQRAFEINIDGVDPFSMVRDDLTAEGVCTSFQVHYCFDIRRFVDCWNALALVTPVVVGVAANSPLLLGHRLWHETRIPLFKQSIDGRRWRRRGWQEPARVDFGDDWLRQGPCELFARMVYLHPPLIPLCDPQEPQSALDQDRLPGLYELCLHNGTVWPWNRPIYDSTGSGHVRIEMRSLPAGPTALDMTANAAFCIGLTVAMRYRVEPLISALPWKYASANFYRAAREGMEARLIWPGLHQNRLKEQPLRQIAERLLEISGEGLSELGVDDSDIRRQLGVIANRISTGRNGARWQLDSLAGLQQQLPKADALKQLVWHYRLNVESRRPVSQWEVL